jgi:phosphatidate cytidylyltransferase
VRPPAEAPANALKQRVVSALVLAPAVLGLVYLGRPFSDLLFLAAAAILAWEWARLCNDGGFGRAAWIFCGAIVVGTAAYALDLRFLAAIVFALGALTLLIFPKGPAGDSWRAWYVAGLVYIPLGALSLLWLRGDDDAGLMRVVWLLAVVWSTDIGAFAAGKGLGGPKLLPAVSPNKTWAGLGGGVLVAALSAAGVAWLAEWSIWCAAALGGLLAVVAQAGDFLESWIKRRHGAKDSSQLIPGHGGLFDRVDGLIAAAIFLAAINLFGLGPI